MPKDTNTGIVDVPIEVVKATLPYLPPTVAAMVQIQGLSGMRPGEVCAMKAGDIDQNGVPGANHTGKVWLYVLSQHKTSHKTGEKRAVTLGTPEQELLLPFLTGKKKDDYIFSPETAEKERHTQAAKNRKSKITPSQKLRHENVIKKPKQKFNSHYTTETYRQAIKYATIKANKYRPDDTNEIPQWTPNQLRHSFITNTIRETGSIDKARAAAGQKTTSITLGYNHSDAIVSAELAATRKTNIFAPTPKTPTKPTEPAKHKEITEITEPKIISITAFRRKA